MAGVRQGRGELLPRISAAVSVTADRSYDKYRRQVRAPLHWFRRLRDDIHDAFLTLGYAIGHIPAYYVIKASTPDRQLKSFR